MRNYSFSIERDTDANVNVATMSGTFEDENAHEAWEYVNGAIYMDGRWTCTLYNGNRCLGTRVFIRGAQQITQRAKELAATK